ncbi:MAG TPA: OmpH family outer membrane protein [Candidatus Kapabacteria bacterium]|nr:OmpH family outer membrane protein [Candidatus Kapabacteria bacterium]
MKNSIVKRSIILAALVLLTVVGASAQSQRIAVVDMKRAFDSYYKTKQAEAQIKERATESDKVYKEMIEEYKKANQDYKTLIDSSNDQAVSAEERDKRKKAAETKMLDLQGIEKNVKQYENQARTTIGAMEKRMRDKIVEEIREVVNRLSTSGGYTYVFDNAAVTAYQTPIILFNDGKNDLTDAVIKEINATAPAGSLTAEPVEKK